jgi:serpin B
MNLNRGWYFFALLMAMSFSILKGASQSMADTAQHQLVSANTGFGFRLLKQLGDQERGHNVFISPYSISSVLEMITCGARGSTLEELQQTLGTKAMTTANLNLAYEGLDESISNTETNALLRIANAVWFRAGVSLNPEFASVNENFYKATLAPLDFSNPHSAETMNDWASQNTQGKIKKIIQPPVPADTAVILANAIYFKGTWLNPFDRKQTKPRPFHLIKGNEEQLPMMEQTRSFRYQTGSGFQAVQLFYTGNRLEMEVLLPDSDSSLEALLSRLDEKIWQNTVLPGFHENRGTLVLPRFKLRYGAELKKPLGAMGMATALSPAADFSGMSSSKLFLSAIKHQSFVEVNEEGTEAAAATTGVMALASMRIQPQPFHMIADRPFLFVISDHATGSILFLGLIFDPGS